MAVFFLGERSIAVGVLPVAAAPDVFFFKFRSLRDFKLNRALCTFLFLLKQRTLNQRQLHPELAIKFKYDEPPWLQFY